MHLSIKRRAMKKCTRILGVLAVLLAFVLFVSACGGDSSNGHQDATPSSASETEQEAEPKKPVATASTKNADFDVSDVSVSENGIDLTLMADMNVMVFPNYIEVAGNTYPLIVEGDLNPQIHISSGGAENASEIDVSDRGTTTVHISIDGVDDYTSFTMYFDEALYGVGSKTYQIQNCELTVTVS